MRVIFILLMLSLFAIACNKQTEGGNEVIVTVEDKVLTKNDLEAMMPPQVSKEDSIITAESFINHWIKDVLMYDIALSNMNKDKEGEINKLVENYRKSLVIYQYQEQLVNEKLSRDINREDMLIYYENNDEGLKLDRVLIKGVFLKVPLDAPQLKEVKDWYKSSSQASLENIEKYSIQNATVYEYFYDRWVDFYEIIDNLPTTYSDPEKTVRQSKQIEVEDSTFVYLVNIKEYLLPGSKAPFEYAEPTIREILINQKKIEYMKRVEEDIYSTALKKGQIKFNKE